MTRKTHWIILMAALLISAVLAAAVAAQDMGVVTRMTYYIAPDDQGVQQVYQLLLDGESQPRQITFADADVITFGAAYDRLSIAYISGGQLWLQPIHTEEPQALAPITAEQIFAAPVYSQDGQYIAYSNDGVWLLDLGTRETRQLLADVPVLPDGSNMADFRLYQPVQFVLGVDESTGMGVAEKLIVDVGIWEWQTAGVYDLETDKLEILEGMQHTSILPLYGDRVLVYGNNGVAGDFALRFADNLESINNSTQVVEFSSLTDKTLFASEAVEVHPGTVRVYGYAIGDDPNVPTAFFFDYDLMANQPVGEVQLIELPQGTTGGTNIGELSPDGALLPVYVNTLWTDSGSMYGEVSLFDFAAGEAIPASLPETVMEFAWQP